MTAQDPVEQAIVEALRGINPSQYSDIDARLEPILRDLVKLVREPLEVLHADKMARALKAEADLAGYKSLQANYVKVAEERDEANKDALAELHLRKEAEREVSALRTREQDAGNLLARIHLMTARMATSPAPEPEEKP